MKEEFKDNNGKIYKVKYTNKKGQKHRENGPASIIYDKNGSIEYEHYFLDGKKYNELEYWIKVDELHEKRV